MNLAFSHQLSNNNKFSLEDGKWKKNPNVLHSGTIFPSMDEVSPIIYMLQGFAVAYPAGNGLRTTGMALLASAGLYIVSIYDLVPHNVNSDWSSILNAVFTQEVPYNAAAAEQLQREFNIFNVGVVQQLNSYELALERTGDRVNRTHNVSMLWDLYRSLSMHGLGLQALLIDIRNMILQFDFTGFRFDTLGIGSEQVRHLIMTIPAVLIPVGQNVVNRLRVIQWRIMTTDPGRDSYYFPIVLFVLFEEDILPSLLTPPRLWSRWFTLWLQILSNRFDSYIIL